VTDISKCHGEGCHKKETCYRYTAPADKHWQSYIAPVRNEDGSCDEYYWKVNEASNKIDWSLLD
jgi:hypothetical protein